MVRPAILLRNYMMSKTDCGKVQNDSEQFCPRLRHVLYNNVRDDSGYLVRHLANDFVRENLGLEWQLLLDRYACTCSVFAVDIIAITHTPPLRVGFHHKHILPFF